MNISPTDFAKYLIGSNLFTQHFKLNIRGGEATEGLQLKMLEGKARS